MHSCRCPFCRDQRPKIKARRHRSRRYNPKPRHQIVRYKKPRIQKKLSFEEMQEIARREAPKVGIRTGAQYKSPAAKEWRDRFGLIARPGEVYVGGDKEYASREGFSWGYFLNRSQLTFEEMQEVARQECPEAGITSVTKYIGPKNREWREEHGLIATPHMVHDPVMKKQLRRKGFSWNYYLGKIDFIPKIDRTDNEAREALARKIYVEEKCSAKATEDRLREMGIGAGGRTIARWVQDIECPDKRIAVARQIYAQDKDIQRTSEKLIELGLGAGRPAIKEWVSDPQYGKPLFSGSKRKVGLLARVQKQKEEARKKWQPLFEELDKHPEKTLRQIAEEFGVKYGSFTHAVRKRKPRNYLRRYNPKPRHQLVREPGWKRLKAFKHHGSNEQREQARELCRTTNLSYQEIKEQLGVSETTSTIARWCQGIKRPMRLARDHARELCRTTWLTLQEIGEQLGGITKGTIFDWCQEIKRPGKPEKEQARELCRTTNLFYREIGTLVGFGEGTISKWCQGIKRPDKPKNPFIEQARGLCRTTNLSHREIGEQLGGIPMYKIQRWCKEIKRPLEALKEQAKELCRTTHLSHREIRAQLGRVTRGTISDWCRGIKRPKKPKNPLIDKAQELCRTTHLSNKKIGEHLGGIPASTIRLWCKGIKRPPKRRHQRYRYRRNSLNPISHGICPDCYEEQTGEKPAKQIRTGDVKVICAWCKDVIYDPESEEGPDDPRRNPIEFDEIVAELLELNHPYVRDLAVARGFAYYTARDTDWFTEMILKELQEEFDSPEEATEALDI